MCFCNSEYIQHFRSENKVKHRAEVAVVQTRTPGYNELVERISSWQLVILSYPYSYGCLPPQHRWQEAKEQSSKSKPTVELRLSGQYYSAVPTSSEYCFWAVLLHHL